MKESLICIGIVTSIHGMNGAVKIKTFTEKPENICLYGDLINDNKSYKIDSLSVIGSSLVIATIKGMSAYEEVKLLRKKKLYIKNNKLPRLNNKNEFYQIDLINMKVKLENNRLYGYIKYIYNFGSEDILEISIIGKNKNVMLPFTKEIFPQINLSERYIILDMPEFIS